MLTMTQLTGFLAEASGNINYGPSDLRFVNRYDASLVAASSGNFTIPSGDLLLDPTNRYLFIFPCVETASFSALSAEGVPLGTIEQISTVGILCHPHTGTGSVQVDFTLSAAVTEIINFVVYEVCNVLNPVLGNLLTAERLTSASSALITLNTYKHLGSQSCGASASRDEVQTTTWVGLTERSDGDAGNLSVSAADALTKTVVNGAFTVTNGYLGAVLAGAAVVNTIPREAIHVVNFVGITNSVTAANNSDFNFTTQISATNDETFTDAQKRVFFVVSMEEDATITGMTWNGVACTLAVQQVNTAATPDVSIVCYYIDTNTYTGTLNVTFSVNVTASVGVRGFVAYNSKTIHATSSTTSAVALITAPSIAVVEGGARFAAVVHPDNASTRTYSGMFGVSVVNATEYAYGAGAIVGETAGSRGVAVTASVAGQQAIIQVSLAA